MENSLSLTTHQFILAGESVRSYNEAVRKLAHVWKGSESSFILDELSRSRWDPIIEGEASVTADLVRDVAKDINTRQHQLQSSRETSPEDWVSTRVRDFEHSTAETALNRTADRLRVLRDLL